MPDPSGARGYNLNSTPTRTTSSPSANRGTGGSSNNQNTGPGAGLGSNRTSESAVRSSSPSSSRPANSSVQGMTTPNRNTTSTVGKGVNFSSGDYMNAGYGSYQQPPSRSGTGGSSTVRQGVNLSPADMLAGGYGQYHQAPSVGQVNSPRSFLGNSDAHPGVNLSIADLFSGGYNQYQQPPSAGHVGMKDTPLTTGGITNVPQGVNLSPADMLEGGYGQYQQAPGRGTPQIPIAGAYGGNAAGVQAYNGTKMPGLGAPTTAHDLLAEFTKNQDRVPQYDLPQANRRAYEMLMAAQQQMNNPTGAPPVSPMAGQGALPSQVADAWSRQDALPHWQDTQAPTQVADAHITPANGPPPKQQNAQDWIDSYRKANGLPPAAAPAKTPKSPFNGLDPNSQAFKDKVASVDKRNQFSPAVLGTNFLKNGLISGPILDALSRSFADSGGMYGNQGNGNGGGGQAPATGNTQLTANDIQQGGNGGSKPAISPDLAQFLLQMFGKPQGPTTGPFKYSTNLAA